VADYVGILIIPVEAPDHDVAELRRVARGAESPTDAPTDTPIDEREPGATFHRLPNTIANELLETAADTLARYRHWTTARQLWAVVH
jgi:hypothetical protein